MLSSEREPVVAAPKESQVRPTAADASASSSEHRETAQTIADMALGGSRRPPAPPSVPPPAAAKVVSASIGLGIDHRSSAESGSDVSRLTDATEAAAKAVADALERGHLHHLLLAHHHRPQHQHHFKSLPGSSCASALLCLRIQLGVPPQAVTHKAKNSSPQTAPMAVDPQRLQSLLPVHDMPLLPLEIHVGGLRVCRPHSEVVTVVASVSLEEHELGGVTSGGLAATSSNGGTLTATAACTGAPNSVSRSVQLNGRVGDAWTGGASGAKATWRSQAARSPAPTSEEDPGRSMTSAAANANRPSPSGLELGVQIPPAAAASESVSESAAEAAYLPTHGHRQHHVRSSPSPSTLVNRTNSMDMLARVSAEMHRDHGTEDDNDDEEEGNQRPEAFEDDQAENAAIQPDDAAPLPGPSGSSSINASASAAAAAAAGSAYNYRKLPPGITPKKNQRLFVKHQYRDHSGELPRSDELELLSSSPQGPNTPARTPNAAFPLKLHETLKQIELDGLDHILGWLPHGRSFKIFHQKEFVESILPRYFVMTKKSSFLRQLNLYGFNRLSGLGPDQGSYYHEKFLRGMKFLSKRMQRQKVNGNGIRAAGDPDSEPNLRLFPPCPPLRLGERVAPPLALAPLVLPPVPPQASVRPPITPVMVLAEAALAAAAAAASSSSVSSSHPKRKKSRLSSNALPTAVPSTVSSPGSSVSGQVTGASNFEDTLTIPITLAASDDPLAGGSASLRGVQVSFPLKLQRILDKLEADGQTDVVGWLPHGRAFLVYDPRRFVSELMPRYFNQSKFSSFQRQLHMYSFNRITASGRDKGAYHHPHFLRGHPHWAVKMRRTRINGKGTRRPGNPNLEPDFYGLPRVPPIPRGAAIEIPAEPGAGLAAAADAAGSRTDSPASTNGSTGRRRRRLPTFRHSEEPSANEEPAEESMVDEEMADGDDDARDLEDRSSYCSGSDTEEGDDASGPDT